MRSQFLPSKAALTSQAPSSSLRLRLMRTRRRKGTPLIPDSQTFLFSCGSRRTSEVPIDLAANVRMALMALGALFLKVTLCTCLCRWMVYSRATTSSMALRPWPCLPAVGLLLFVA